MGAMPRLALLPLAAAFLLAACGPRPVGPAAAVPVEAPWRSVATTHDRERLREWRTAFTEALEKARASGHGPEINAEGALLRPDATLPGAKPPPGDYACRVTKLGAKSQGLLDYVTYSAFACRIGAGAGDTLEFVKLSGSQRPAGRLFPENPRRMIFLGTLQLGDEAGTLRYGHDPERDMAGILERIGDDRWRLIFPYPAFESTIDVLELVPAS